MLGPAIQSFKIHSKTRSTESRISTRRILANFRHFLPVAREPDLTSNERLESWSLSSPRTGRFISAEGRTQRQKTVGNSQLRCGLEPGCAGGLTRTENNLSRKPYERAKDRSSGRRRGADRAVDGP